MCDPADTRGKRVHSFTQFSGTFLAAHYVATKRDILFILVRLTSRENVIYLFSQTPAFVKRLAGGRLLSD